MLLSVEIGIKTFEDTKVWYEVLFQFMRDNWGWIASVFGAIFGVVFCVSKSVQRKRANAVGGFYSQLKSYLKPLKAQLDYYNRINPQRESEGNIYLIEYRYDEDEFRKKVSQYSPIDQNEIQIYQQTTTPLVALVVQSENNVNPLWTRRKTWEKRLNTVVDICRTITNPYLQGYKEITNTPTYVSDGKELLVAIEYILKKLP